MDVPFYKSKKSRENFHGLFEVKKKTVGLSCPWSFVDFFMIRRFIKSLGQTR